MVVFLDTNVFLHYRRFTEIDWLAVTGERQVTIAFPPITLRELNEKKDGGASQKIKRRAQAALIDIEKLFRTELRAPVRDDVWGECIPSEPQIDFADHQLRGDIQDDWLIASVLEHKGRSSAERHLLVTSDLGLKLKCRAHKIEVLQLSDDLKLPEEEEPEAKRIRQLEAENLALKAAVPVLELSFVGGKNVLTHAFRGETIFDEDAAHEQLGEAKRKLKRMPLRRDEDIPETATKELVKTLERMTGYDPADVEDYNESLEAYFNGFIDNARERNDYENVLRRSYPIEIGITNDGTVPAEEIVIHMHFPDGFSLCFKKDFPEPPQRSEPPSRPLKWAEKMQNFYLGSPYSSHLSALARDFPIVGKTGDTSSIRRTNSFDVDFSLEKLNHGFTTTLKEMVLTLDRPAKPISFHVEYEIHAANLPRPRRGSLHVVIE